MFDRTGRDAIGRSGAGSRGRAKAGRRFLVEPLEGRALMTASLAPIPSVTVEAGAGYQVPLNGAYNGNTDPQTYTVTTNTPSGGVAATVATGQFWSITVNHVSSGPNDPAFSGTMVYQLFQDLTPNSAAKIESLINGTVPYANLTAQAQPVIYPNGANSPGRDYYLFGGNTIHRVANLTGTPPVVPNDYIVQGGSLNGDGTGQVFATPYANETSPQLVFNESGQLALANSGGTSSNDSQFFATTGLNVGLNGNYTIFGQLVSGANILTDLSHVAVGGTSGTTPLGSVDITGSSLSTTNPDGVIHINAANSTAGTLTNVTVTATDTVDGSTTSRTFPVFTIPSGTLTATTSTPPTLLPVATPITTNIYKPVSFQLGASNPTGNALTYTVQGGVTGGAFTSTIANATATVSASGLVTVTPTPGYTGPINLVVGVQDGVNRAGTAATASSPANYSLQNVTINVAQPVVTGAVRFILDSSGGTTGNLVITPPPRPSPTARNTISVTQNAGSVQVTINGVVDSIQPAVTDVDSIIVYGSKANDTITIDPTLTMPATLNGGTGGKDVLTAGGGPTREQGWHGTSTVEKQGSAENFQFGRAGHVTFVKGTGTSNVIFAGTIYHPKGHSRIRRIPPPPRGTFYTFSGDKLVKTHDPFTTKPASSTTTKTTKAATKK